MAFGRVLGHPGDHGGAVQSHSPSCRPSIPCPGGRGAAIFVVRRRTLPAGRSLRSGKGSAMGEPGADRVNERTRAFAAADARVVRCAGRGPTIEEEAAADRAGGVPLSVVWAYREMLDRGAWQQGEGRPGL